MSVSSVISKGSGVFVAAAGEVVVDEDAEEEGDGEVGGGVVVDEVKEECSCAE
jgi:hypothetical protein